ncbi:MAG: hypothetical protein PWQ91_1810 [Eubacteriales bacterium]|nr:hypothetical protein [Eubacteriales bacterium]
MISPWRLLKLFITGGVVFLFLLASYSLAFAVEKKIEDLVRSQSFALAQEAEEVKKALSEADVFEFIVRHKNDLGRKELKDIDSPQDLSYGTPYKVYIPTQEISDAIMKNKPITPLLEKCSYFWEVPILNRDGMPVTSCQVALFEGKWQVVEVGGSLAPSEVSLTLRAEKIASLFADNAVTKAESFYHIRDMRLRYDFLVVSSGDEEYFIPLRHSFDKVPDEFGLTTSKVYRRSQVANAVGPTLKMFKENPNLVGRETGGGIPYVGEKKGDNHILSLTFVTAILFVVVVTVIVYLNRGWLGRTRTKNV